MEIDKRTPSPTLKRVYAVFNKNQAKLQLQLLQNRISRLTKQEKTAQKIIKKSQRESENIVKNRQRLIVKKQWDDALKQEQKRSLSAKKQLILQQKLARRKIFQSTQKLQQNKKEINSLQRRRQHQLNTQFIKARLQKQRQQKIKNVTLRKQLDKAVQISNQFKKEFRLKRIRTQYIKKVQREERVTKSIRKQIERLNKIENELVGKLALTLTTQQAAKKNLVSTKSFHSPTH